MEQPLVSVITPSYNQAPYLPATIRSILRQEYENWEWVIVDDGSTDGSVDLLSNDDPRIKVWTQHNQGPAVARNNAFARASGAYITFLDADDEYLPQKISRQVEAVTEHPECAWSICGSYRCGPDGKTESKPALAGSRGEDGERVRVSQEAFADWDPKGTPVAVIFMKRECYETLNGFHPDMRCFEVTELMTRLCLYYPRGVALAEPLVRVNDVPDSAYKDTQDRVSGILQMAESYLGLAERFPRHARKLSARAHRCFLYHANGLTNLGTPAAARRFLFHEYFGPRGLSFWKACVRSVLPRRPC